MPEHRPRFLTENFFSVTQFPTRVLTASGEDAGFEAYRVSTSRRIFRDRWETAATPAWVQTQLPSARTANFIAVDRGHNLGGRLCVLEHSPDGAAWTTAASFTIPATAAAAGTELLGGARTREGAYVRLFTAATAAYWRFRVEAGGLVQVVGLWVGLSWQPNFFLEQPADDYSHQTFLDENISAANWRAGTLPTLSREGTLRIRLSSFAEFDAPGGPKMTFIQHYQRYRPCWMVLDQEFAEDTFLARIPAGARISWQHRQGNWTYRSAEIPYIEHEPLPFQ